MVDLETDEVLAIAECGKVTYTSPEIMEYIQGLSPWDRGRLER